MLAQDSDVLKTLGEVLPHGKRKVQHLISLSNVNFGSKQQQSYLKVHPVLGSQKPSKDQPLSVALQFHLLRTF